MNREEWWASGFAPPRKAYGPEPVRVGSALGRGLGHVGVALVALVLLPFYVMAMIIKH